MTEATYKEHILISWNPSNWKINNLIAPMSQRKQQINSMFAIFCVACAYGKWWQTKNSKEIPKPNKPKQKNIE